MVTAVAEDICFFVVLAWRGLTQPPGTLSPCHSARELQAHGRTMMRELGGLGKSSCGKKDPKPSSCAAMSKQVTCDAYSRFWLLMSSTLLNCICVSRAPVIMPGVVPFPGRYLEGRGLPLATATTAPLGGIAVCRSQTPRCD